MHTILCNVHCLEWNDELDTYSIEQKQNDKKGNEENGKQNKRPVRNDPEREGKKLRKREKNPKCQWLLNRQPSVTFSCATHTTVYQT